MTSITGIDTQANKLRKRGYDVELRSRPVVVLQGRDRRDKWGRRRTTADALEDGNLTHVLNETR
jgi:hypothetical protein